jgi:putative ABC transport system permease protein
MRKRYIAARAAKSLKQSKARTLLTALAIAVGATTICLSLAAGNGGRDYINRTLDNAGISRQEISVMGNFDTTTNDYLTISPETVERIRTLDGVDNVQADEPDKEGNYIFLTAMTRDDYDVQKISEQIGELSPNLTARTAEDNRKTMFDAINVAQWGLIAFGALAVLASIFGIINTQYISVLERTRQIGLMKALGMKRGDVSRLVRYEAAWIGALGGAIGVAVAWLITLANPLISNLLNVDGDVKLLRIDWLQAVILIIALMIVAVLSGWFPSRKAAKLDPIEALRTE